MRTTVYTPKHLAEKILTSRSALEGERKQVTVPFCDLANSTPIATRLGPEHLHTLAMYIGTKGPLINFWAMGLWHYSGHLSPMRIIPEGLSSQRWHYNALCKKRIWGNQTGWHAPSVWDCIPGSSLSGRLAITSAWTTLPSGIPRIWRLVFSRERHQTPFGSVRVPVDWCRDISGWNPYRPSR
jgi:hypothetical protein